MAAKDVAPIAPVETDLFGEPGARDELLRRAAVVGAQRRRQSTSSTQTRGEVTASAQKLYRQKGVGRARAGSASAGQRRGGAVTFGPRPRTVRRRLSRRERREALRSLLGAKGSGGPRASRRGLGRFAQDQGTRGLAGGRRFGRTIAAARHRAARGAPAILTQYSGRDGRTRGCRRVHGCRRGRSRRGDRRRARPPAGSPQWLIPEMS